MKDAFRTRLNNLTRVRTPLGFDASAVQTGFRNDIPRGAIGFPGALVVSEIALACVLLVDAGVLLRRFLKVLDVDLGFQPDHTTALHLSYGPAISAQRGPVVEELLRREGQLPGVEAVAFSDALPLQHSRTRGLYVKGKSDAKDAHQEVLTGLQSGYLRGNGAHADDGSAGGGLSARAESFADQPHKCTESAVEHRLRSAQSTDSRNQVTAVLECLPVFAEDPGKSRGLECALDMLRLFASSKGNAQSNRILIAFLVAQCTFEPERVTPKLGSTLSVYWASSIASS